MTNILNYLKTEKIDMVEVGGIVYSFYLLTLSVVDEILHCLHEKDQEQPKIHQTRRYHSPTSH